MKLGLLLFLSPFVCGAAWAAAYLGGLL